MKAVKMQKLAKWIGAAVIASGITVGGVVAAQNAPGDPSTEPAVRNAGEPAAPGGTAVVVKLTPDEMRTGAASMTAAINGVHVRVLQLRSIAAREKDVLKINCLNDKLVQIKGLLNVVEQAATALTEAFVNNDDDAAHDYYSTITYAHEKAMVLKGEAETCVGEDLSFVGDSEIIVDGEVEDDWGDTTDPVIPDTEPTPVGTPII